jgi:endonuclease III-like uncharacterized protein
MAIVQTAAQLLPMARSVGITDERSAQIKALGDAAAITTLAGLRTVVNSIGYYNEKADHLVAAGLTMA